jgi:Secretion system C-terminal sorting domain
LQQGAAFSIIFIMRLLLLLCFLQVTCILQAQQGFSKTVLLPGSKACTFASLVVDEDTLVCFGTIYGISAQKWGVCLSKFDSAGNFLQMSTDFDSTYKQTVDPTCQLLRTSDGGYLGVASQGIGKKTAAYKFSHTGELEWKHFYREPDFQVVITYSAQELADGYLCFGLHSINSDAGKFVMKLSKSGELLWFSKGIDVLGYVDLFAGRHVKRGDNIILASGLGPISGNVQWSQSSLIEIDTNGQLVRDWYGDVADKESGPSALALSPEGNIVYATRRYFTNPLNGFSAQLKFRCVQPVAGNTLWQTELPTFELSFSKSLISQVRASPNGSGFDAIGFHSQWYDGFVIQGILAHYDWEGNLMWQRYDTVHVDTVLVVSENKLYNMAHLSSGSIIGVGDVKRSDPYPHTEGWLIKWSPNGCLEENDCAIVSTHEDLSGGGQGGWKNWEVYPNPASDHTWLYPPDDLGFKHGNLQISNASGQVVRNQSFEPDPSGQHKISLEALPKGLYFYQVIVDGKQQQAGRLVVI